MNFRRFSLVVLFIAVCTGLALYAVRRPIPATPPPSEPAPPTTAQANPDEAPAPASPPGTAKEWEAALGGDPELVSEQPPAPPAANRIKMIVSEKLAQEPLSDVPHVLIGAWDEAPDSPDPGVHRAIVAVVEPTMSDADLEQLIWDVRAQHATAEVLDIRVYDSAEAATTGSAHDGGAERAAHLVADTKRNDRLDFDQTKIRGRIVER